VMLHICSAICWTQTCCWHRRPQGGARRAFPPGNSDKEAKISRKPEISSLIVVTWVNSCNDSWFADVTLTLHKSQVHCSGNMQWWACSLLNPLLCLQRQVAKSYCMRYTYEGESILSDAMGWPNVLRQTTNALQFYSLNLLNHRLDFMTTKWSFTKYEVETCNSFIQCLQRVCIFLHKCFAW